MMFHHRAVVLHNAGKTMFCLGCEKLLLFFLNFCSESLLNFVSFVQFLIKYFYSIQVK